MKIGIDIDNTITEVQEELNNAAYEYAIKLGKDINKDNSYVEETDNNGNIYVKKFKFTYEELKYFLKNIQEEIINKAKPRNNAVEIIKKLKEEKNEIFIITARDSEFHDNPYILSQNWLEKNNIEYDKLIVNAREKGSVCKKEKIDIFIDNQLKNCLDVAKENIQTIRITKENKTCKNVISLKNWDEIYKFIREWSNK